MTDIDPYFTPSLPATALYATAHGIRLALGSALHERQLLDVRGDMAIECMDQMLLVRISALVVSCTSLNQDNALDVG